MRYRGKRNRRTNLTDIGWYGFIVVWAIIITAVLFAWLRDCASPEEPEAPPEPEVQTMEATLVMYEPEPEIPEPVEPVVEDPSWFREDVPLDRETQELLQMACEESGVGYELALAVIHRETTYRNIIGDNGDSFGYMQVQPRWHSERMEKLGVTDLMDPLGNFRVGCDYLAELLAKYPLEQALTFYNTGSPGHNRYADEVISFMAELME